MLLTHGFPSQGGASSFPKSTQNNSLQGPPGNRPAPGTLIIKDTFTPSSALTAESPHGHQVEASARQQGFQGSIERRERDSSPLFNSLVGSPDQNLGMSDLSKEKAGEFIDQSIVATQASLLTESTNTLQELVDSGAKNTVTNLSLGHSKASVAYQTIDSVITDLGSQDQYTSRAAGTKLRNHAKVFDLNLDNFFGGDSEKFGEEMRKWQQGVIDRVDRVTDTSPIIKKSRSDYAAAVKSYESNNNSVVISAGNEGGYERLMEAENGGRDLRTPRDFSKNILETEEVTSVGATRWFETSEGLQERRADYSSRSEGVDIYASGSNGYADLNRAEAMGTSYASPRVGATMAELHRQNPELSSSQVESLLSQSFTHQLNDSEGQMQVLDFGRSFEFLKNTTY